jgi:hypothetical protein
VSLDYPSAFKPGDDRVAIDMEMGVHHDDKVTIRLPRSDSTFPRAPALRMLDNFGNKPLVGVGRRAMFAELGIVQSVVAGGWQARWVCTFGRPRMRPMFLTEWDAQRTRRDQVDVPIDDPNVCKLLERIATINGKYGGCWDVVAWKGRRVLFLESKLHKKDHIQVTQMRWLLAAFEAGLSLDNFVVVEWNFG